MTDSTFTFGTTPESVVREALEYTEGATFRMEARGIDAVTLAAACCSDGEWDADELIGTLRALLDVTEWQATVALIDRGESNYTAWEIVSNAASLRTGILSVLGIEEI
jgi:hypothetical protein